MPALSEQENRKFGIHHIATTALLAAAIGVAGGIGADRTIIKPNTPKPHDIPGGQWLSPQTNEVITNIIPFKATAYPTSPGDPPIDHVNFTINVKANTWVIACSVKQPIGETDVYSCNSDPAQYDLASGRHTVSFDVYDVTNNHNNAPNGTRPITYQGSVHKQKPPTANP